MSFVSVYRCQLVKEQDYPFSGTVSAPEVAGNFLKSYFEGLDRETVAVLLLNTKNNVIGLSTISVGTLNASLVHAREVFKVAILGSASSIILAHNHPSGDPTPSHEDTAITDKIEKAGEVLGISCRDHLVMGDTGFYSFTTKQKYTYERSEEYDHRRGLQSAPGEICDL